MIYRWNELSKIPSKQGVYAWYYVPEITDFDLKNVIQEIRDNPEQAENMVSTFLYDFIFKYFQEEPYKASLFGSLKPKYEGSIDHKPELSTSLIERIIEKPDRLNTIREVLEKSVPNFSSPMYIGMSKNVHRRIQEHESLIRKYSSIPQSIIHEPSSRDQSFAMRLCSRGIPPNQLVVCVNIVDVSDDSYIDIENILNRIHYPLLGRN
jgi:hypothetical protein